MKRCFASQQPTPGWMFLRHLVLIVQMVDSEGSTLLFSTLAAFLTIYTRRTADFSSCTLPFLPPNQVPSPLRLCRSNEGKASA